jgi:hypothetical protein
VIQADSLSTTIAPASAPSTGVLFLILIRDPRGDYIPESRLGDLRFDAAVNDIASGQFENVMRVIACDEATGRTWDASKQVATAVLGQVLDRDGIVPVHCRWFLEEYLGVNAVQRMIREAA